MAKSSTYLITFNDTTKYIYYYNDVTDTWSSPYNTTTQVSGNDFSVAANAMYYDLSKNRLVIGSFKERLPYLLPNDENLTGYLFYSDDFIFSKFINPIAGTTFNHSDSIYTSWIGMADTVLLYYTDDNQFSWKFIDTVGANNYSWFDIPMEDIANLRFKAENLHDATFIISDAVTLLSSRYISILSPIDSTGITYNLLPTSIIVETAHIDKFSLFYAVNDTLVWYPIIFDIVPENTNIDTTTYEWYMPIIYGAIYIKASSSPDTILYEFTPQYGISGPSIRYYPAICWNEGPIQNVFQHQYHVDQTCGWVSGALIENVTSFLDDYGTSYSFSSYFCSPDPCGSTYITSDPIYTYTLIDTTTYNLWDFYESGDSVTYKNRTYFFDLSDSTLRCTDNVNDIDSIFLYDFSSYVDNGATFPTEMYVYNVQRSKIQNEYYPVSTDFEALNDELFKPLILFTVDFPTGRGQTTLYVEALDEPNDGSYVQDVARIFLSLSNRRDYFRGIDPKARKSGR